MACSSSTAMSGEAIPLGSSISKFVSYEKQIENEILFVFLKNYFNFLKSFLFFFFL